MTEISRPLTRIPELFPGQFGVHGSDVQRGVRTAPTGIVLYVDKNHADAADAHDGTDPEHPMLTIQGAVNKLVALPNAAPGSIIAVMPGTYIESVLILGTAPAYCAIVGLGYNNYWPSIVTDAPALDAISLSARGWTIKKLRVTGGAASAGIRLYEYTPGGSYQGAETLIEDCFFDGAWAAFTGLEFEGAPGMVTVRNCKFSEHRQGANTAYAIRESLTPQQNAYECQFINNLFFENQNHVRGGFGVSLFEGNKFLTGSLIPTITHLDLRGGTVGTNLVTGNHFSGDYSNTGGYWAHAADDWVGNTAQDVAEAEVSDSSLTVAIPAA